MILPRLAVKNIHFSWLKGKKSNISNILSIIMKFRREISLTTTQWVVTTGTPLFTTGTQLVTTGTPLVTTGLANLHWVTIGSPRVLLEHPWKHPWAGVRDIQAQNMKTIFLNI
jgi:hypothetical protein